MTGIARTRQPVDPSRTRISPGAAVLVLVLGACGGGETAPRWVPLARVFRPEPLLSLAQRWQREAGQDPAGCTADASAVRVSQPLPRSAWERGTEPDTWTAGLPGGAFSYGAPGFLQLRSAALALVPVLPGREFVANTFRLVDGRLERVVFVLTRPPDRSVIGVRAIQ